MSLLLLPHKVPDDREVSAGAIRFYYEHLLPFEALGRWLSYRNSCQGPDSLLNDPLFFSKREVCLTCRRADSATDEFFMRWQSFRTGEGLRERLVSMGDELFAHKFDWGAVYSLPVAQREIHPSSFRPQQKELVLDIDMDDYDDVRTCCRAKKVCSKCWQFLAVAIRLLDTALREDFGFRHILWVFSGRRGVHAWVCDTDARLLPNESRGQLAEYLNICGGSEQQAKKVQLWGRAQHPSVDRAFAMACSHFHRLLKEQDFFFGGGSQGGPKTAEGLLQYLPDSEGFVSRGDGPKRRASKGLAAPSSDFAHLRAAVASAIEQLTHQLPPSGHKSLLLFEKICSLAGCQQQLIPLLAGQRPDDVTAIPLFIKEIVLAYSYPRLDINVSKDMGHLLKSPFCIHQGTGRVCVPIDVRQVEAFDPERVPTLSLLRREFDLPDRRHLSPLERTSLRPFVQFFKDEFLTPLDQTCAEEVKFLRENLETFSTGLQAEYGF